MTPYTQALEPFIFPKLLNHFADFPNLHYSTPRGF